ncbi:hypothetical protein [Alteromonas macleodii]|uniref:hypothetical protein n=1 Tax=Alteromonas macleodii TaxID=28108 RepID=UPI00027E63BC|nr:hypothetical protein [Alteromonas macleodii]AFS38149.1 hypothetical protein MASE_13185 [Alteromonas macleodii ATCC 27126]
MKKKNLLFTSFGDQSVISSWCGNGSFDIWACYYGDEENIKEESMVDFFFRKKGGKLQNFDYAIKNYSQKLMEYDSILLADDDIIISRSEIESLFEIRNRYAFKAMQPAFDLRGKISHPPTKVKLFSHYRTTNFIEITFVLFEKNALFEFMKYYRPEVNCWGVDWWFSYFIRNKYGDNSLAIVDSIKCLNPHDAMKKNGSEIAKLASLKSLAENWARFQEKNNIVTDYKNYKIYHSVAKYDFIQTMKYIEMVFGFYLFRAKNMFKKFLGINQ